jgi:hypothetical protein
MRLPSMPRDTNGLRLMAWQGTAKPSVSNPDSFAGSLPRFHANRPGARVQRTYESGSSSPTGPRG